MEVAAHDKIVIAMTGGVCEQRLLLLGAGEGARDEQQGGPCGGERFGGGWLASRCREARGGGGRGWCGLPEAWGLGWSGRLSPGIFNIMPFIRQIEVQVKEDLGMRNEEL